MSLPVDGRTTLVAGTGLIGTSIALALRSREHRVLLTDSDPERLRRAESRGAGEIHEGERVDLAVVAVPPRAAAAVVRDLLPSGCTVTDTTSVKAKVVAEVEDLLSDGVDGAQAASMERFVGGHPVAGSERSGPEAARADLFTERAWILTPLRNTSGRSLQDARWLVDQCGARTIVMIPEQHDRALALTSHLPQLLASALAAQLASQPDSVIATAGPGLRDMIRVAASDPDLWMDITASNAEPIAERLEGVTAQLARIVRELRNGVPPAALRSMLTTGRDGQRRVGASATIGERNLSP